MKKFIEDSFSVTYAAYFFDNEEEFDDTNPNGVQVKNLFQGINSSKVTIRLKAVKKICGLLVIILKNTCSNIFNFIYILIIVWI